MSRAQQQMPKIAAPVSAPDEVAAVAQAGADEVYCGVLPGSWAAAYGDWDTVSRRQGSKANVPTLSLIEAIARGANRAGLAAALTLNVRYTRLQLPVLLDIAAVWEQAGGNSVLVSDLSLFEALGRRTPHLQRHLSILAAAFNSRTVRFYERFGVRRVVLPRALTIAEMGTLTRRCPGVEFEVMAMNEKCEFIDGMCGFYHGKSFPEGVASCFSYEVDRATHLAVAYERDLGYAGHACELPFKTASGATVRHAYRNDYDRPHCAACFVGDLVSAGISLFKVGGRGFPAHVKTRAVSFLRRAITETFAQPRDTAVTGRIQAMYKRTFGCDCTPDRCYYQSLSAARP